MTIKPFLMAMISLAVAIAGTLFAGYAYIIMHDGTGAAKVLFIAAIVSGFLYGESEK